MSNEREQLIARLRRFAVVLEARGETYDAETCEQAIASLSAPVAEPVAWTGLYDENGNAVEQRIAAPPAVQAEPVAEGDTIQSEELPPVGHPLRTLGERLTHWLDDDQWNNAEPLLLEAYSLCSKDAPQQSAEPVAWERAWSRNGETPKKERNENGRMAWPKRFKFLPVTKSKILPDDFPLYAAPPADDEAVRLLREARKHVTASEIDCSSCADVDKHKEIVKASGGQCNPYGCCADLGKAIDAYLAKVGDNDGGKP